MINRDKLDAVTRFAQVTSGTIKDKDTGERIPCLRIHKEGDDPEDDMVVPLTKEDIVELMQTLYLKYQQLEKDEQ